MNRSRTVLGVLVLAAASVVGLAGPAQAIDEVAPQVNFNRAVKPVLGTQLSDSTSRPSISATVAWTAYDPSGVSYQQAQVYNYDTRTTTYVTLSAGQRSFDFTFRIGTSYRVALWAQDPLGNGSYSYLYPYFSMSQEGAATLSPGWSTSNCNCWSGGAVLKNTKANAKATYAFSGTSIAFVGDQASDRGTAKIFVDGVQRATVNMQRNNKVNRLLASVRGFAAGGQHTIQIVVQGTAGHPRVDVDAFVVGNA